MPDKKLKLYLTPDVKLLLGEHTIILVVANVQDIVTGNKVTWLIKVTLFVRVVPFTLLLNVAINC